jgi:hypothetical protein
VPWPFAPMLVGRSCLTLLAALVSCVSCDVREDLMTWKVRRESVKILPCSAGFEGVLNQAALQGETHHTVDAKGQANEPQAINHPAVGPSQSPRVREG